MAIPGWLTRAAFQSSLANAGGAGSRTAAELPPDALDRHLSDAWDEVAGRLFRFTLPASVVPAEDVSGLLLGIVYGIAGYTATLEFFGSQPVEANDPIVLRYQRAESLLGQLAAGKLELPDIAEDTPGEAGGEPEVYDQVPYLGIAEEWQADEDRVGGYARRGIVPGSHW